MRVVLLGLGTVGGAVGARLLDDDWRAYVEARGLRPPTLLAVGVRDPGRQRAIDLPASVERTEDLAGLVVRDDVDVVVELIGGLQPAGKLIERALEAGKSVVTANKALLAELGPALERLARRNLVALRFEAAVAGGIPLLSPLARDLAATRINGVRGIVNGTTNFILSAMSAGGRGYGEVLADAQSRGYAEADPTGDVEGRDAAHKLVLLTRLAFGVWPQPAGLRRTPATLGGDGSPGISGVSADDIAAAAEQGLALKLVAFAGRAAGEVSGRLVGWVEPCAVPQRSLLGSTDGVLNAVEVLGSPLGRVALQGPGAGGDATSNAVLADLLSLQRTEDSTWAALPEALPLRELDAGHGQPVRWFWREDGRGCLSEPSTLDNMRTSLAGRLPPDTTLYRVLDEG